MNPRRLYRSHDRMLAGVAGGMAEYLDLDPSIVRIAWIVVGFASAGMAIIAYILLAIVIPSPPYPSPGGPWTSPTAPGAWAGQTAETGGAWQTGGAAPGNAAAPSPAGPNAAWASPPAGPQWQPQPAAWSARPAPQPASRGIGVAAIAGVVLVVIGAIALADAVLPGIHAGIVLGPAALIALGAGLLVASLRRSPAPAAPPAQGPEPADPPVPPAGSASGTADADAAQAAPEATAAPADRP